MLGSVCCSPQAVLGPARLRSSQTPLSVLWLPCKHTLGELSCSVSGMQLGPLQIDPNRVNFCVFEVWFAAS